MSQLHVSASPHFRAKENASYIMKMVLLALMPATIFGIFNQGIRALAVVVVAMASCVIFETLMNKAMHRPNTINDCSALVTGLLLGINMPVTVPLWVVIVGAAFAICVAKMIFGGLGQNIVNPALAGRCFLVISFATYMTDFTGTSSLLVDAVSTATPLSLMKSGEIVSLWQCFIGTTGGTIGETSALLLIVGGLFLVWKKIIDVRIPLCYLGSFAVMIFLFGNQNFDLYYLLCQMCSGGLMLGAWFMATDYVTSPITPMGRVIFGLLLGVLTALFRINSVEGVSFAILFANLLVPIIERYTRRRAFGIEKKKRGE